MQIEDEHLRLEALNMLQHGRVVSRLSDHFKIPLGLEQSPQTATQRGVVIGQHDAYWKPRSRGVPNF